MLNPFPNVNNKVYDIVHLVSGTGYPKFGKNQIQVFFSLKRQTNTFWHGGCFSLFGKNKPDEQDNSWTESLKKRSGTKND